MAYISILCHMFEALTVIRKSHCVKSLSYIHKKAPRIFIFFLQGE